MYAKVEGIIDGVEYELEVAPCSGEGEFLAALVKNDREEVCVIYITREGDVTRSFRIDKPRGGADRINRLGIEAAIQAIVDS